MDAVAPRSMPIRRILNRKYKLMILAYLVAVTLLSYQPGLTIAARATGVLLGAGFLFLAATTNRKVSIPLSYRIWIAWFFFALFTSTQADYPDLAAFKILTLVQIVPIAFVLTNYLLWSGSSRFYTLGLVFCALASCAMVLIFPRTFSDMSGRVFGPLGNANAFGIMLVTALIFVMVGALCERRLLGKLLFLAAAGLLFAVVLQTGSRQAIIGTVVGGFMIIASYVYGTRAGLKGVLVSVAILAVLLPVAYSIASTSKYWYRMEVAIMASRGDTADADSSLLGRMWLYQRAWEVAVDHPLFGAGLDNFRMAEGLKIGSRIGTYSHSNYMEILASTGFPGFLLYFSILWHWYSTLYRSRHLMLHKQSFSRYTQVLAITVAYTVMDFTSVSYYDKCAWLVFPWLIAELEVMRMQPVPGRPSSRARRRAAGDADPEESDEAAAGNDVAATST